MSETSEKPQTPPSLPEKVTLVVSTVVVLTLLGFLGWQGFTSAQVGEREAAPMVTVSVSREDVKRRGEQWVIPLDVENTGNVPLEAVHVKVKMRDKNGNPVESDLEFVYLAEGAKERAFVLSENDPAQAQPKATVESFHTQQSGRGY